MALNLGNSGNFRPFIKYDSKAGRWFVREDKQDVELTNPSFVADFANIATGWIKFEAGQPPKRVLDPDIRTAAPDPQDGSKRGFVLALLITGRDGAHELGSASMHLKGAINVLYGEYEARAREHPGKLAVVACKGSLPMKDRHGTNYRPRMEIVDWVGRPDDLPDEKLYLEDRWSPRKRQEPMRGFDDQIPF
jgi:hypothetical protein